MIYNEVICAALLQKNMSFDGFTVVSVSFDQFFEDFDSFEYGHQAPERSVQQNLDHLAAPVL